MIILFKSIFLTTRIHYLTELLSYNLKFALSIVLGSGLNNCSAKFQIVQKCKSKNTLLNKITNFCFCLQTKS